MIERARGNLLDAQTDALVNTVNTVGIMGKGVALQFKKAFPGNYKAYRKACAAGLVKLGAMFIHDLGGLQKPRYIINFPTKKHWRAKSRIADIESGLQALVEVSSTVTSSGGLVELLVAVVVLVVAGVAAEQA